MKYLDGYPELDLLSKALSFSSPNLRVSTRIEAYSCKAIARERKLFKTIEHDLLTDLSLSTSISPPEHHQHLLSSAFGPLDLKSSRKTLWLLIATLNIAFPDHDFSTLSAEEFVREENPRIVLASLTSALEHLRSSNGQEVTPAMPLVLEGYSSTTSQQQQQQQQQRIGYSASAPSASTSSIHHHQQHAKKMIEQQKSSNSKQQSSNKGGQSSASLASNSEGNKKKASAAEANMTTSMSKEGNNDVSGEGDKNDKASTSPTSKKAQLASQHQPRTTKSNISSNAAATSTTNSNKNGNSKKKKDNPPISHDILISKLRNELDGTYEVPTHPLLRQVLDPIIDLSECDVYSYTPDLDSDPHAYQSEDEEEEEDSDEDGIEDDGGNVDDVEYERHHSDGLDMDLEDDGDDTCPYYTSGTSMAKMRAQEDEMQWEMEGVEDTTSGVNSTAPGTPTASGGQQDSIKSAAANTSTNASSKKSAQKKRNSNNTTSTPATPTSGGGSNTAKKSKSKSNTGTPIVGKGSAAASSRTKIIPGQSIFADLNQGNNTSSRGSHYQYGSLDDYSYTHHRPSRSHRRHSSSMSSDDADEGYDDDDDDTNSKNNNGGDDESDNGGLLWSSNYFFYNRKMKRILFVSCWGRKIGKQFSPSNALLGRSAGNPLHAYRRQLLTSSSMYNHHGLHGTGLAGGGRLNRDGRVTINLNRPRAGSSNLALPPTTTTTSSSTSTSAKMQTQDENGSSSMTNNTSSANTGSSNKNANITTSSLTQALRANASNSDTATANPSLNTSFASQPPIANAASIFKPSSPFPRSDNRPGSTTPSSLNYTSSSAAMGGGAYGTSPTDDPQPPSIRATSSRQGTPISTMRRARPNSGSSTPARKTPRRNSAKRRTGSRTPGAGGVGGGGASSAQSTTA